MKKSRKYLLLTALAVIASAFSAGAFAGHGPEKGKDFGQAIAQEKKASHESVEAEAEAPATNETHSNEQDNQGACVSSAAKEEGLEGWRHGLFVSSVAQSDLTGPDCDYSEQLAAAQNATGPGKSDNESAGQSNEAHGNSEGESKAEEAHSNSHGQDDENDD